MENETSLVEIKNEVNKQLADPETFNTLVLTTFKGIDAQQIKTAIMEGMMRGFSFKDFLEKNIYAVPFSGKYSLVTSIDYARKVGMRSGIVGKLAPEYEEKDGKIISCTVTVKRKVNEYVGEYTARVFFVEYYKAGKNGYPSLWDSKPHTMIAKVAEMHALRMACPEELSQNYVEEEMQYTIKAKPEVDIIECGEKLEATKSLEEFKRVWSDLPVEAKNQLESLKNRLKEKFKPVKSKKVKIKPKTK
ncbi:hypothetical protein LCGC14_1666160 [marine sediment metagenome]|uniref:Phage recombination protein Bet n=1 Tax=marine sediment metagenome TaxID=412755 RepID=A0A0F9K8G4_9ZZZZ